MFGSTHTIRRLAGLAVVAGAFAALVPVAQADSGFQGSPDAIDRAIAARNAEVGSSFQGSPDAIDRAVATRQAQESAAFDAREHAQLALTSPSPDVVEPTVAGGQLQYLPEATTSNGFDWNDFGIGAGAGIGLMLLLGLGIGLLVVCHGNDRVSTA